LISIPVGRFVAAATLALRFRTEQSFLGASDEPLLLLLSLRFRTDKTFAAAALALRFRTDNIRFAPGSYQ
jgi:hypothetical protein